MAETVTAQARIQDAIRASWSEAGLFPYGVMFVVGVVFWWGSTFHASIMPFWAPFDFSPLWFAATALTLYWYARGVAMSAPRERPALWRSVFFLLGIGVIYFVLQTRFEYLAEHMFFLNRTQHVVMHHIGPFQIALAWQGAMLRRGMPSALQQVFCWRPLKILFAIVQQPFLAAVLFVGLIALWLWPPVHFRAMIDPRLYAVMNWSMVVDGILFWCLVLDPRPAPLARTSFGVRAVLTMTVMFPQIIIGAMIVFAHHDLYSYYAWCGRIFPSIGPLDDQQYGGLIVWIPSAMMSVVGLVWVINMLRISEESAIAAKDDSDAEGAVFSSRQWTGR
jgi:putative membrane protein